MSLNQRSGFDLDHSFHTQNKTHRNTEKAVKGFFGLWIFTAILSVILTVAITASAVFGAIWLYREVIA